MIINLGTDLPEGALLIFGAFARFKAISGGGVTEGSLGAICIGITAHPASAATIWMTVFIGPAYIVGDTQAQSADGIATKARWTVFIVGTIGAQLFLGGTGTEQRDPITNIQKPATHKSIPSFSSGSVESNGVNGIAGPAS